MPSHEERLARALQEDEAPEDLLTPEQLKRKNSRERKRKQRAIDQKEKAAARTATEREWWEGNRSALSPEELQEMQAQDERCHDLLDWMELCGYENEGFEFVSVEEITNQVVEFVKAHEVTHLGRISKNNLPADWPSQQYWRNADLMLKLTDENKQTEQFVKFGLLAAPPDWRVIEFLTDRAGWTWQAAAQVVGYYIDNVGHVSYAWPTGVKP
jgi:hypothetical protein